MAQLSDIPWPLLLLGGATGTVAGIGMGAQTGIWPVTAGLGALVGHFGTLAILASKIDSPEKKPRAYETILPTVRVPVWSDDGHHGQYPQFNCDRETLAKLAYGLINGKPFTEAAWTGPRKPFTARQFADIRGEMITMGWARWRSDAAPQRGAELTAKGRAVMRGLAGATPPSPTDRMLMLRR